MSLLDDLRNSGCKVVPGDDWETHAAPGDFTPIGILNHWDAINGWPGVDLYRRSPRPELNNQPTYHVVIQTDGTCHLISQGHVYGAGGGDADVYEAMRTDTSPIPPAEVDKSMGGNTWFWAVCVNYWPDGDPLPHAQYDALVRVNAALCRRAGWNPLTRVNDHDGWTTRKDDLSGRPPENWDLGRFRGDVKALMEGDEMVDRDSKADDGLDIHAAAVAKAKAAGAFTEYTQPGGVAFNDEMATVLDRLGLLDYKATVASLKKQIAGIAAGSATAGVVIAEIIERLAS